MRSRFLEDLPIRGRESVLEILPSFDFYNLRRVIGLSWSSEPDSASGRAAAALTLTAIYDAEQPGRRHSVLMRCSDVRQLRLPDLGPSFFLAEVEVEDLSEDQLEGVRYRIKDFGESSFEVLCGDIEIGVPSLESTDSDWSGEVPSR